VRPSPNTPAVLLALALLAGVGPAHAAAPFPPVPREATAAQARKSGERGLAFLQTDAEKWRKERKCATCHHGTMTVWAFSEAKSQGYAVKAEAAADLTKWTVDRFFENLDKPRDKRPGWSMVNTPALYLAVMALAVPKQEAVSAGDLKRITGHLLRHQESDGSWAWSSAPPKNRPPPHFESDEVATLLADLALGSQVAANPKGNPAARESREKAAAWLAKNKPSQTTQALALGLLHDVRAGKPAKEITAGIDRLLSRQNRDGGWGQDRGLSSDAYATGQALYFLSLAGVKKDRAEVKRGVSFLVATQKEDGHWPITARAHKGEKPANNVVPITYFGTAWATLGMMRSVPK
jgi:Squalene-hopene cyclase C-terminal domain